MSLLKLLSPEHSPIGLIDTRRCRSLQLFTAIIRHCSARNAADEIALLCYQHSPAFWRARIGISIHLIDGWTKRRKSTSPADLTRLIVDDQTFRFCFIDSLQAMLLVDDDALRTLHRLAQQRRVVVVQMHRDVLEEADRICASFQATIQLVERQLQRYRVEIWRAGNRRIVEESIVLDGQSPIGIAQCLRVEKKSGGGGGESVVAPDPAAALPFTVHLSKEERDARLQLQLPHERLRDRVLAGRQQAPPLYGAAAIHYEPDALDDIDDEDPDDDLEI